jgi:hypothetical protein
MVLIAALVMNMGAGTHGWVHADPVPMRFAKG